MGGGWTNQSTIYYPHFIDVAATYFAHIAGSQLVGFSPVQDSWLFSLFFKFRFSLTPRLSKFPRYLCICVESVLLLFACRNRWRVRSMVS